MTVSLNPFTGACHKAEQMRHIFQQPCNSDYFGHEDHRDYTSGWEEPSNGTAQSPWTYQSTIDAKGVFIMGKLGSYEGGGYIVEIGNKRLSTQTQLDDLFDAGKVLD